MQTNKTEIRENINAVVTGIFPWENSIDAWEKAGDESVMASMTWIVIK
jgi:hypothetical protein